MLFVHAPLLRAHTQFAASTLAKGLFADAGGSGRGMWPDDGSRGLLALPGHSSQEEPPRGFHGCSPARRDNTTNPRSL